MTRGATETSFNGKIPPALKSVFPDSQVILSVQTLDISVQILSNLIKEKIYEIHKKLLNMY